MYTILHKLKKKQLARGLKEISNIFLTQANFWMLHSVLFIITVCYLFKFFF